jgi:hypothetical protein
VGVLGLRVVQASWLRWCVVVMELPYGFESRHNAVDPAAALFSKQVVSARTAAEVRDEAVRQKYLSMSIDETHDSDQNANDTGGGGGGGGVGRSTLPLPVGWGARTAASAELTSPAAVSVQWSQMSPRQPQQQQSAASTTASSVLISSSGVVQGSEAGGGGASRRQAVHEATATAAAANEHGHSLTTPANTSGGSIEQVAVVMPTTTSAAAAAEAQAVGPTSPVAAVASSVPDVRRRMAALVLRLHQISQMEAVLAAERGQVLQQLTVLTAGMMP